MKSMTMWMTVAMFVVAGCGSGASVEKVAPAAPAQTPVAVAPVAAAPAVAPAAVVPVIAAATPVPPGAAVLASGDGERAGSRVEVHELKRGSGGTLTMKFSIVNDSDEKYDVGYSLGNGSTTDIGTVGGVHLTDPVEKKKYLVVRDGDSRCLCSQNVADFPRGRAILWAKFPAPPAGTERVTVVVPHFMPMDDVSISM